MKKHFVGLMTTRGNNHRFLGMSVTINQQRNVEIEMKDQMKEAMGILAKNEGSLFVEDTMLPANRRIREVNPNCAPLCESKKDALHSIVEKLLWTMKRERLDLETAIIFCALEHQQVTQMIEPS